MTIESQEDVDALKRVGRVVSLTLQTMLDAARPGMTTGETGVRVEKLGSECTYRIARTLRGHRFGREKTGSGSLTGRVVGRSPF